MALGRGGSAPHSVYLNHDAMKNAPYFATAPLGPDGRPRGFMPNGWNTGRAPVDPSTGSMIGFGAPIPHPELYAPAGVPLPPSRPGVNYDRLSFGRYLDFARPQAAAGNMPTPALPPNFDTSNLDATTAKAHEAHAALEGLNTSVSPHVENASLRETLALLDAIHAKLGGMSGTVNVGVNQTGSAPGRGLQASLFRAHSPVQTGRIDV